MDLSRGKEYHFKEGDFYVSIPVDDRMYAWCWQRRNSLFVWSWLRFWLIPMLRKEFDEKTVSIYNEKTDTKP